MPKLLCPGVTFYQIINHPGGFIGKIDDYFFIIAQPVIKMIKKLVVNFAYYRDRQPQRRLGTPLKPPAGKQARTTGQAIVKSLVVYGEYFYIILYIGGFLAF